MLIHRSRRFHRAALAATLTASALLPAGTLAQDVDAEPLAPGPWKGGLVVTGHLASDSAPNDGSFTVAVIDVLGDTDVSIDFDVAEDGTVSGSMPVRLHTLTESAGADVYGDPFHVTHDKIQEGTLALSGDSTQIVASGELTETTETRAQLEVIPQMSGASGIAVEWVFDVSLDCAGIAAPLASATGASILRSALLPEQYETGPTTAWNKLQVDLFAYPDDWDSGAEAAREAEKEAQALADALDSLQQPTAEDVGSVVSAWYGVQQQILDIIDCPLTWAGDFIDRPWLVGVIQRALTAALEGADAYAPHHLIGLWDVAHAEAALDGPLKSGYLSVLGFKLDDAIAASDSEAIEDIAAFASDYGYTEMQTKAEAAL